MLVTALASRLPPEIAAVGRRFLAATKPKRKICTFCITIVITFFITIFFLVNRGPAFAKGLDSQMFYPLDFTIVSLKCGNFLGSPHKWGVRSTDSKLVLQKVKGQTVQGQTAQEF